MNAPSADVSRWSSVRKPLTSDDVPVAKGFHEHPRVAVTIPCPILVRILRDHPGRLRTYGQSTVPAVAPSSSSSTGLCGRPRHHDRWGGPRPRGCARLPRRSRRRAHTTNRAGRRSSPKRRTPYTPYDPGRRRPVLGKTLDSAVPPPAQGPFCPPLPPLVVDYVSRQRISSAVVAARCRGSSSRARASRRKASSGSGRYSVCSTQMFTYGPSRNGSLLCVSVQVHRFRRAPRSSRHALPRASNCR